MADRTTFSIICFTLCGIALASRAGVQGPEQAKPILSFDEDEFKVTSQGEDSEDAESLKDAETVEREAMLREDAENAKSFQDAAAVERDALIPKDVQQGSIVHTEVYVDTFIGFRRFAVHIKHRRGSGHQVPDQSQDQIIVQQAPGNGTSAMQEHGGTTCKGGDAGCCCDNGIVEVEGANQGITEHEGVVCSCQKSCADGMTVAALMNGKRAANKQEKEKHVVLMLKAIYKQQANVPDVLVGYAC
eukprot:gnl/MRDRNA2_/MRDRNA2_34242_c0_seq1.p1 gnl/MRDRNA2_/MRDRNA2_34242_c0~~gnl/MRDRNA2_/MRDRNA2_34242_c0_seq1.p1  ORF type:complete len:245 (+),score=40.44 gnl/MRDRNA2_/MRDRNA2_34242_c0_seq1:128-862(+)